MATCFSYAKFKNWAVNIHYREIPLDPVVLKTVRHSDNWNIFYDSIAINMKYGIFLKKYTNCPRMFEDIEQDTLIVRGKKYPITGGYQSSRFNVKDSLKFICCDITSLTEITYNNHQYLLLVYYTQGILGSQGRYIGLFLDLMNNNITCIGNVKYFPIDGLTDYDTDGKIDFLFGQDTMKIYSYDGNDFIQKDKANFLVCKHDLYSRRTMILSDRSKWFYPIIADGDTTCCDTARMK